VNDIAALTHTHQSSVSVVIQRLVRRRLVVKVPSREDRRRQRLALTGTGRRALNDAPVAVQEHLIAAIAAVPETDRRVLARALDAIAKAISPHAAMPHAPMFFEGPRAAVSSRRG
jgi:DNA-binding MarR family transcriptional regulator